MPTMLLLPMCALLLAPLRAMEVSETDVTSTTTLFPEAESTAKSTTVPDAESTSLSDALLEKGTDSARVTSKASTSTSDSARVTSKASTSTSDSARVTSEAPRSTSTTAETEYTTTTRSTPTSTSTTVTPSTSTTATPSTSTPDPTSTPEWEDMDEKESDALVDFVVAEIQKLKVEHRELDSCQELNLSTVLSGKKLTGKITKYSVTLKVQPQTKSTEACIRRNVSQNNMHPEICEADVTQGEHGGSEGKTLLRSTCLQVEELQE